MQPLPPIERSISVSWDPPAGWERFGAKPRRARKGYRVGWGYVLNVFGEQRTAGMALLDGIAGALNALERLRGGSAAAVARAGGELPRA
jgi:hypothetical protein